jgi:hypothetical protein
MIKNRLPVLSLLMVFLGLNSFCVFSTEKDNLSDHEKKSYKFISFAEISQNPKDAFSKNNSKFKFQVIFNEIKNKLPAPYDQLLPSSYETIVVNGGKIPQNGELVPLVYSNLKKNKLREDLLEVQPNKLITVYASIKTKKNRASKKTEKSKYYYLYVYDIDTGAASGEDVSSLDPSEFKQIKFRRLDIQFKKYLDQKVKFDIHLRDIGGNFNPKLEQLGSISTDDYFIIYPKESFHTLMVASRDNENCVGPLVNSNPDSILTVCGILRKLEDPSMAFPKPVYYFYVYGIMLVEQNKK